MADIESDTLFTNSIAKGIYLFSEGPTGGLKTGDAKSIYLNDLPLQDANGVTSAKGVSWTWRRGTSDQTYIDGFPSAVTYQNVGIDVKLGVPYAVTIANGSDQYDAAYVVVAIPQLVFNTSKGNQRKTNVGYEIQVKANGGAWVTQHSVNMTQKCSSQWEGTYRVELPVGGSPWQVRLSRTTMDSDEAVRSNGEQYLSQTVFARYATITDGKFTYRNTAVLGIQYDAEEYGTSIPAVKVLMKGIECYVPKNYDAVTRVYATTGPGTSAGLWDGTFKLAVTDNPFWVYHDLVVNNRYGLGQDFNPGNNPESAFVDKWALYSLAQYADGMVSNGQGGQEPRFTVNCQITNKQEAYDLLQNIIASANGMLYFSAEKVIAVSDRPMPVSDAFTQADVEGGFFEYSGTALKSRHSVCIVNYKDPTNLYKSSNVIYEDPEYISEIGYRVTEVDAFGCTSRAQALRVAKWTLRTERTQTQTVSFKTGSRGGLLAPGDIIKVFDDYKTGQRTGGRILSAAHVTGNTTFVLDAPVTVSMADKLIYVDADGLLQEFYFAGTYTNTATVTVTGERPLPVDGAMFAVVFPSLDGQQYRIIVVEESQDDGKYVVSGLLHDPAKYAYVDQNLILDVTPTTVLSAEAPSMVTGGAIDTSYTEVSGTQVSPRATITWEQPKFSNSYPIVAKRGQIDDRIASYELQFKTPWSGYSTIYNGTATVCTTNPLEIIPQHLPTVEEPVDPENPEGLGYQARVRSIDSLGRVSGWYTFNEFFVKGREVAPNPVTSLTATSVLNGIALNWTNPPASDFKHVEIKVYELDLIANPTAVMPTGAALDTLVEGLPVAAQIADDFYILQDVINDNPRHFFLTVVSHNPTLNRSSRVSVSANRKQLEVDDFGPGLEPVQLVNGLPNPTTWTGSRIVFDTVTDLIYNLRDGAWVVSATGGAPNVTVSAPTGVSASSTLVTDNNGQQRVTLAVTWTAPADAGGLGLYEIELAEGAGPAIVFSGSSATTFTKEVLANTLYKIRVRSVSSSSNRSAYAPSIPLEYTTIQDTVAPSAPTWGTVLSGIGSIRLQWTNPSASDLKDIQIFESTTDTIPALPMDTVNGFPSSAGNYSRVFDATDTTTRYYWLKAVDRSGNVSVPTVSVNGTPQVVTSDSVAPGVPTWPVTPLTTSLVLDNTGTQRVRLRATWTSPADSDLAGYDVRIKEGVGGNYVYYTTTTNSFDWDNVNAGATYYVSVRAFDRSGNRSAFSTEQSLLAAYDTTAPDAPTSVTVSTSINANYLRWTNPTANDLAFIDVYENTSNVIPGSPVASLGAAAGSVGAFSRTGLTPGTTYYYWLKARDRSGNLSVATGSVSATIPRLTATDFASTISPVELFVSDLAAGTPSVGRVYFNTTNYTLFRGNGSAWVAAVAASDVTGQLTNAQLADIAAAKITGQITTTQISDDAISTPKIAAGAIVAGKIAADTITANEIAANAITATEIAAGAITAGKIAANAVTANEIAANSIIAGKIAAGAISATEIAAGAITTTLLAANAVTAAKIAVGTITANEIAAGTITGTQISASSQFPASITVSGTTVTLGGLTDPAVLVNSGTTRITPGQILISGTTTLANWRNGTDATKIEGGSIAANTISANKITIGQRGVQTVALIFEANSGATNRLSWTAGSIIYTDDTGASTAVGVASGTADWTAGYLYVYWTKGSGVISTTTNREIADTNNTIILATYTGGLDLTTEYGRTIIDGSNIKTGSITATQISAGTITASLIASNTITANKIAAGTITANEIAGGTITGDKFNTGTSLPGTITVGSTGVSIGTIQGQSANPASVINSGSTRIDPGLVLISGTTYLSDWRQGGDTTKIAGGSIAANTISANKITIGNRGITVIGCEFQYVGNQLTWSSGYVLYPDDVGGQQAAPISNGAVAWGGGGYNYIYWPKGAVQFYQGVDNWNAIMAGDNIIMCTWANSSNFVANHGGTVVHGDKITTGTVHANRLVANSITASQIAANSITADRLTVTNLAAISASLGTVTTGFLQNSTGSNWHDMNNGRSQYTVGSYVKRIGNIGTGVLEWFGLASVPVGSETRTNGVFAQGDDGKVYLGTTELTPVGGFNVDNPTPSRTGTRFGAGAVTSNTATLSATGFTGTMSYTWTFVYGDSAITATSPTGSATAFTATVANGETKQAMFTWRATDSGTGITRSGQVGVGLISNA